jgi:hypothetical protein
MFRISKCRKQHISAGRPGILGTWLPPLRAELLESREAPAAFTAGNLALVRVGDGSAGLSNAGTAVFIDEYKTDGTAVNTGNTPSNGNPLPTMVSEDNFRLVGSGSATSEGTLTRSSNGQYLVLTGFDAATGTTGVATAANVDRVVGRVDASGTVNTSTKIPQADGYGGSGSDIRSAASIDGTAFWTSGTGASGGGIHYIPLGASAAGDSTPISTTVTNTRAVQIFGGQLYATSASGSNIGVNLVGTGLPTTSGQTISLLIQPNRSITAATWSSSLVTVTTSSAHNLVVGQPFIISGMTPTAYNITSKVDSIISSTQFRYSLSNNPGPATDFGLVSTPPNPNDIALLDRDPVVAGLDTMYIADQGQGLIKYSFNGTTWTYRGILAGAFTGVAATVRGANADIYMTSGAGANNSLVKFTDTAAFNATLTSGSVTTLATAGTNKAFRGISFTPESITFNPDSLPDGLLNTSYGQTISYSGAVGAPAMSITSGSLPHGLSFDGATGKITGIPDTGGTSSFTVSITDSTGATVSKSYSVTITSSVATSTSVDTSNATTTYGTQVTFTATVHALSGNSAPSPGSVEYFDNGVDLGAGIFQSSSGVDSVWIYQSSSRQLQAASTAHTIEAVYSAGAGFAGSSGALSGGETVNAKNLTVTGITADDKPYDGGADAVIHVGGASLQCVISGDTVNLEVTSASGMFADKNVGDGKTVAISGLSITGADAGNYSLTQPSATASITAKGLTVTGVTADDKPYDGDTGAAIHVGGASLQGVISGDTVELDMAGASGAFADKNVGDGKTVAITGLSIVGADAGNYSLTQPSATASITAKGLTVTGVTADDKAYDGDTGAVIHAGSASLQGIISGDTVNLDVTSASGAFADKNVGEGKAVAITGLSITGADAGNYSLTQPSATASITAKGLTVTGVSADDKPYDGDTGAVIHAGGASLQGVISGDTVSLDVSSASGVFADKNVGNGKTVAITGLSIVGEDAGNYSLTQPSATASITAKGLTVTGVTADDKPYDGDTSAVIHTSASSLQGVISGDSVDLDVSSASGVFADKNVGNGKTVAISGLSIVGADAGNYSLTQPSATASITAKGLTVTGVTADDKPYDGDTGAAIHTGSASLQGVISGDTVSLEVSSSSGAFADKNVGDGKTVAISGLSIVGADAGNYSLTQPSATASITAKGLTVTGITADNKPYDGDTGAAIHADGALLQRVISGDTVNLEVTSASGVFADKNVGDGKTVAITGLSIVGADAGNYSLTQPSATASITAKGLTVTGVTADDKPYDGDTDATIDTGSASLQGIITGDTVNLDVTNASGAFADKNVGDGKTVAISGLSITGADAGNYSLIQPSATASITAKGLTVTGVTADDKPYDGGTDATIDTGGASLQGVISGDSVDLDVTSASGVFADKNAGDGKTVAISGLSIVGADAGNYSLIQPSVAASITTCPLTVTAVANTKVYDGTTSAAALPDISPGSVASGDAASFIEAYDLAAPGTGKTLTPSGSILDGNGGHNYSVRFVSVSTGVILPLPTGVTSFDLMPVGCPVEDGYQPLYPTDTPTSGQYSGEGTGWIRAGGGAFDRAPIYGSAGLPNSPSLSGLLRSGEWGYAGGGANDGELQIRVTANRLQMVTVIAGDVYAPRDNMNVYVGTPSTPFGTKLNPSAETFNTLNASYQFVSYSGVIDPGPNSIIWLSFETLCGGTSQFWTVAGLDVRPLSSTAPLSITRTSSSDGSPANALSLVADGSSIDSYLGNGAGPFAELTIDPQYGMPLNSSGAAVDVDPAVKGFQIEADSDGNFAFSIKRPSGVVSSVVSVCDVTGASATGQVGPTGPGPFSVGSAPFQLPSPYIENYTPLSIQRFDLNSGNSPTVSGFTGVLPASTFNANAGYGWKGPVGGYDRGAGTGGSPTALFEDGAWGAGSGVFEVGVPAGSDRDVRVYVGDPYAAWTGITVKVEGNATPVAVDAAASRYGFVTLNGSDANADGVLDITILGGTWVASGIDVATTGNLPEPATAVPPSIPAAGVRLQFANSAIAGFVPVSSATRAPTSSYGWTSPVSYAVRPASMFGNSSTLSAAEKQFYGSFAYGTGAATFQLAVPLSPTNQLPQTYLIRAYLADPYATWPAISLKGEGMATAIVKKSSVNPPLYVDLTAQDRNRDGFISLTISGSVWVINALDVVENPGTLPAAP